MLANAILVSNRVFVALRKAGRPGRSLSAYVVNYADDLVICCRPGHGSAALATMRQLMARDVTCAVCRIRLSRLQGMKH